MSTMRAENFQSAFAYVRPPQIYEARYASGAASPPPASE
jgi:hypothetical protein